MRANHKPIRYDQGGNYSEKMGTDGKCSHHSPVSISPDVGGGERCAVHSLLDGRTFERSGVDVGVGDPIVGSVEYLRTPGLLEFAGIERLEIPSYPISQQIAEKLHAFTRNYGDRRNSRVRDLPDMIILIHDGLRPDGQLLKVVSHVFRTRGTHPLPVDLPDPPAAWHKTYARLANDLDLPEASIDEAMSTLRAFWTDTRRTQE